MITFDHYSRNSVPVNPEVYRIRTDVTWEHVVYDFFREEKDTAQFVNGMAKTRKKKKKERKRGKEENQEHARTVDPEVYRIRTYETWCMTFSGRKEYLTVRKWYVKKQEKKKKERKGKEENKEHSRTVDPEVYRIRTYVT